MDLIQCRVCRTHTYECVSLEAPLSDGYSLSIANTIHQISSVDCSSDDGLPFLICDSCIDELIKTYKFVEKIRNSDRLFHEELSEISKFEEFVEEEHIVDEEHITEEVYLSEGIFEIVTEDIIEEIDPVQEKTNCRTSKNISEKLQTKENQRMHRCLDCGKEFKRRDYLSNHIRFVHKKVRPFLCSMCRK